MPFERPSLSDLVTRIRNDFQSRLGIAGALLRRAMADVLAVVWAGAVHVVHGHIAWLVDQLFVDTAEEEFLLRRAAMYGITKIPAEFASGTITATGTNGEVIPSGTVYVRDDGATYTSTADSAAISGGTTTVSVQADEAGAAGNMGVGETLTLESPITNVDSEATVVLIDDGSDEETTEALRARFKLRLQEPPEGGAEQDYEAWALAVAGVTRVWVYPLENGLGTVVVRFVRDNDGSGSAIIPSGGEVTAVQDAIDAERPVTADVTVEAPTALTTNFTMHISPDTSELRAAVQAELEDLFFRLAEPGDGAGGGTIPLSQIRTAIGTAELDDFTLASPAADVVPALGELPIVGNFTFT